MCGALSSPDNVEANWLLERTIAMLTKLGNRGYSVREEVCEHRKDGDDTDSDTDSEPQEDKRRNANKSFKLTGTSPGLLASSEAVEYVAIEKGTVMVPAG